MATYLILNLVVMTMTLGALTLKRALLWSRATAVTLGVLVIMTTIFDSLIISADIVRYSEPLILGLHIGLAPVEDFFYTLLAVILVPSVWHITKKGQVDE